MKNSEKTTLYANAARCRQCRKTRTRETSEATAFYPSTPPPLVFFRYGSICFCETICTPRFRHCSTFFFVKYFVPAQVFSGIVREAGRSARWGDRYIKFLRGFARGGGPGCTVQGALPRAFFHWFFKTRALIFHLFFERLVL